MASKEDRSKTSKTARVMSLLSKKQEPAPEAGEAPAANGGPAPVPPILTSLAPDAAVSGDIKNALEAALAEELSPSESAAPAAQTPPPVVEAPPAAEAEPAPAPVPEPPDPVEAEVPPAAPDPRVLPESPEPPAPVPPAAPAAVTVAAAPAQEEPVGYINVMEVLVAEKAEKYVKLMGMCSCRRCMDDLIALTLNHLPPKYVVMGEGDRIPKLTFYEGQYSSDITAQLINACKLISERPHHTREL